MRRLNFIFLPDLVQGACQQLRPVHGLIAAGRRRYVKAPYFFGIAKGFFYTCDTVRSQYRRRSYLQGIHQLIHIAYTLRRVRVAVKNPPARVPVFGGQFLQLMHGHQHSIRTVAGFYCIGKAFPVCRAFVRPAVPGSQRVADHHAHSQYIAVPGSDPRQDCGQLGPHIFFKLVNCVAFYHMPDLMPQHACQFRIGRHVVHQPLEHINKTAGAGQRIHVFRVQHLECIGQIFTAADIYQALSDTIYPVSDLRIIEDSVTGFNLSGSRPSHFYFLFFTDHSGFCRPAGKAKRTKAQNRNDDFKKMFHVKLLTFFQHACQTYLSLSVTGTTKQRSNDSFGLKCSDFFFCVSQRA